MPTGTLTADAVVAARHITLDAWIVGSRLRHDRTLDHFGTQVDTTIVLTAPIGKWPAGTDLHTFLLDLVARVQALEGGTHHASSFSMSAFIRPTFRLDAAIRKVVVTTKPFDAVIVGGKQVQFTFDALLRLRPTVAVPFDAWLIDSPNGTWEDQSPAPAPDGSETIFTVDPYAPGTTTVTVNGVAQVPGVDYDELNPNAGTIQFTTPPSGGSTVVITARYCA